MGGRPWILILPDGGASWPKGYGSIATRSAKPTGSSITEARWNRDLEHEFLHLRFELDEGARVGSLAKGMRAQLALVCAIGPEPDLLILDERTSGLDPVVRREFIETMIGAPSRHG